MHKMIALHKLTEMETRRIASKSIPVAGEGEA